MLWYPPGSEIPSGIRMLLMVITGGGDLESAFFMGKEKKKQHSLNFTFNSLAFGMKGIWQVNPLR